MVRKSMSQTKREEDKVAKNASNKRKWEGNHNESSSQQNKGHKVPRSHTTRPINKKAYVGSLPLCNQCKFHHNGPCTVKWGNCNKSLYFLKLLGFQLRSARNFPTCFKVKSSLSSNCVMKEFCSSSTVNALFLFL
ncbi:hypothetical protein Tco_0393165 [Tanacetum coccineum]